MVLPSVIIVAHLADAEKLRCPRRSLWHRRLAGDPTGDTPVPQLGCRGGEAL